jgi:hypothetical protein
MSATFVWLMLFTPVGTLPGMPTVLVYSTETSCATNANRLNHEAVTLGTGTWTCERKEVRP